MKFKVTPTYASNGFDRDSVSSFEAPRSSSFFDPHADLRPRSVLIADDDPNISPLVIAALKPYRTHTETVTNGADALTRLRERTYDLVILDLEMGGMHGFEVLRALRESPRSARIPVLILTGNGTNEALARSFGYGADEFVKKPFDTGELGVRAFRLIRPSRH